MVNWNPYLESLCKKYAHWWKVYTLTDVEGQQSPLFDFMVEAVQPAKEECSQKQEKTEPLDVLEGLRKYAPDHVLLVGQPGSGKSTALARLLLEEAEKAREEQQAKVPVLVELRYYQTSVLDLIRDFLKRHRLRIPPETIDELLFNGGFLLLVDGINELSSTDALLNLKKFREDYPETAMIFTTRDLGIGGDLGITKKLEMQPLTELQMRDFVKRYLPEQGQMLWHLGDRLREFGQTPLLLMMLCSVFRTTGNVPPNLGLVFRQFTQSYERQLRQDAPVTAESRRWWQLLLEHLALRMTQGRELTQLQVAISREEAEKILTEFLRKEEFDKPRDRALCWLQDLLNHHLIQLGAEDKIEFRHQLIQEYYTAESLLKQLPQLSNDSLKREYLNYLKWTEPLALMLELVEQEDQAVRLVQLALKVDLELGARLAGAVKPEFQVKTVALVAGIPMFSIVKIELLGITRSDKAIQPLRQALNDEDADVRDSAVRALEKIGSKAAIPALRQALNDENFGVRTFAKAALVNIELLPHFSDIRTTKESNLFNTIAAIQQRRKYYNYTLISQKAQSNLEAKLTSVMHILHLSDLHFGTFDNAQNWYSQLAEDLKHELNCPRLDTLILSGDIANKSTPEEYNAAKQFLDNLCQEFQLQPQQIVIVPGNHDLNWDLAKKAYKLTDVDEYEGELNEGSYIKESQSVIRIQDEKKYKQRFAHFSEFYQSIKGKPYPLEYDQQGILHHFPEQNLLILALNSAWQLDHHYKSRASINANALSKALTDIRVNSAYKDCLKLAVWHHPLNSAFEDRIKESNFLELLAVAGFRFFLHGHVHEAQKGFNEYDAERGLYRICAGTFGAPTKELPTATAWQYHLLKFEGDTLAIRSRKRKSETGAWEADNCWRQGKGKGSLDYYTIPLVAE